MQGSENTNNVVSLFDARAKATNKNEVEESACTEEVVEEKSFDDIMSRNMKNLERMRKERNSKNKSVLRSYRIKH